MSKNPYGANPEMLLLLAWLSTLDLPELARKDRRDRLWKYPSHRACFDPSQQPGFPECMIQEQVTQALHCFEPDPIYGPVFEAIARDRLTYIDFSLLSWAIELQDLADVHAALYVSNNPYYAERQQRPSSPMKLISSGVSPTHMFHWRIA